MAASFRDGAVFGLCLMAMVVVGSIGAEAQLSTNLTTQFYDTTCPQIYDIVKAEIQRAVAAETRIAASLIRLHFHDCFVQGCDGSLLLNNTPGNNDSEKFAPANNNSVRGFPVIDAIKAKLEAACPQTVSCADILAIASRDSAVEAGLSPGYPVFFGRRDSLKANLSLATTDLPAPFMTYSELKANFEHVGLDEVDLVALSGAHTIGRVRCAIILLPQLNGTSVADEFFGFDPAFHQKNIDTCNELNNVSAVLNLDHITPDFFDNWYYKNLLNGEGALGSDQVLFHTPDVIGQPLVAKFAFDPAAFFAQFALSTIKMGNIQPLTGDQGEIRLNCAVANNASSPNATLTSPSGSAASLVASQ